MFIHISTYNLSHLCGKQARQAPLIALIICAALRRIFLVYFIKCFKETTGLTPQQYIKEAKLQKAREYLELQTFNSVKAVALSVGLKHVKNFSTNFKKRFGRLPSSYF